MKKITLRQMLAIVCGRIQIVDPNAKEPIVFEGTLIDERVSKVLHKYVKGVCANQNDGTISIFIGD